MLTIHPMQKTQGCTFRLSGLILLAIISCQCSHAQSGNENILNDTRFFPQLIHLPSTINTEFGEYVPIPDPKRNQLYFTRNKYNLVDVGNGYMRRVGYSENVYAVEKKDGIWTEPLEKHSFNIPQDNNDICGISYSGDTLLLYSGAGGGNLFYNCAKNDEWSVPKPFPANINNKLTQESDACLSADGRVLYFVRDNIDKDNDQDIYRCVWSNGKWGDAERLDTTINSDFDDRSPYLDASGRYLFFSSKGHNTMGGFDIFVSVIEDGGFSKPINLGYPINSIKNDLFFTISHDLQIAYFSSDRIEGQGEDLYEIDYPIGGFSESIDWGAKLSLLDSLMDETNVSYYFLKGLFKINNDDRYGGFAEFIQLKKDWGVASPFVNPFCSDADLALYYTRWGSRQYDANDFPSAIASFSRVLVVKRSDTTALLYRGLARFYSKDLQGALDDLGAAATGGCASAAEFKKKIIDQQTEAAFYNKRAIGYFKEGSYDLAIADLDKVLEILPTSVVTYKIRAEVKLKKGDTSGACSDWALALKLGDVACESLIQEHCEKH